VTGFVSLCCEVVWTRLNGLLLGASVYAFAAMLFVVIAGISAGSAIASRALQRGVLPARVLSVSQAIAAAATFGLVARLAPLPVDLLGLRTRLAPLVENYDAWLLLGGGFIALHLLPAAMALGASFPALLAAASRSGVRTDRATAWILASNTLGNLTGALGGGFLLMPWLGLEYALLLGGALSLAIALVTAWRAGTPRDLAAPIVIGVVAALLFALQPPDTGPVQWGLFRQRQQKLATISGTVAGLASQQTLFREDGKDASVVVTRYPNGILVFRTNGKADGSTVDVVTQVMLGHLGLLFGTPAAPGTGRDVFVVGLGTGQTAAALAVHPDARVTVAELSPSVVDVARLFRRFNHDVLRHPRVHVVVADAREVLRSFAPASLDLVVSEPSNPWVVGVADLYTIEHFQRVRERLRPNGVLVQWIHSYEISEGVLRAILCTLHSVFPHVAVFRMDEGDLALVASAQPQGLHRPTAGDLDAAERTLLQPEVQGELASHGQAKVPRTLDHWLATQLCGPATVADICGGFAGALEERFPRVEYEAPRDFFAGTKADAFVRRLDTRIGDGRSGRVPDTALVAHLQRKPLDAARRASLHDFLASGGHERERPLVAATAPAGEMPVDLAAVLDALPDPQTLTPQKRARYCVWLHRQAPWVLDRQHTALGPLDPRPSVQAWPAQCRR
ncbi:MAG: methyltransferase domain-containing protein, partial [Myxococcales bacterium]|nr:methyltransferase domain-containing protein [Myxococcales bacterium]